MACKKFVYAKRQQDKQRLKQRDAMGVEEVLTVCKDARHLGNS